MTDLGSGAAVAISATAGAGIASLLPGLDVSAVLGSFAGALFFVVFAYDTSFKASLGYLLSAEAVARDLPITSWLSALASSALFVIVATGLLEWMKGGPPPFWAAWALRYVPGLRGKKDVRPNRYLDCGGVLNDLHSLNRLPSQRYPDTAPPFPSLPTSWRSASAARRWRHCLAFMLSILLLFL